MTCTEYHTNCPECKCGLIYDYNKGEIVCKNCGRVVMDQIDDYGPESNPSDFYERSKNIWAVGMSSEIGENMTAVEETENLKCQTDFDNNCNKINETENDELNAKLSYQDIGGLNDLLQKVKEIIELPLTQSQIFKNLGIEPPKGILLFGPPGTGKTLLAKAISN